MADTLDFVIELYIRNGISKEIKFGELLTGNADDNTEPSLKRKV